MFIHTEGKWYYKWGWIRLRSKDERKNGIILGSPYLVWSGRENEQKANGVLMAAAPELLHYARLFCEYLNDIIDDPEDFRAKEILKAQKLFRRIEEEENSDE